MGDRYIVNRAVTKDECHWLDATVPRGTAVYKYTGVTYGCIGSGIAVSMRDGETPFFEMPRDAMDPAPSKEDE